MVEAKGWVQEPKETEGAAYRKSWSGPELWRQALGGLLPARGPVLRGWGALGPEELTSYLLTSCLC